MGYKNPKELLNAATALPAAIEGRLPEGAPKISATLLDATAKMPDFPDFPFEIPALPAIPELPAGPGAPAGLRRFVTAAEVRPFPAPSGGKRGMLTEDKRGSVATRGSL